VAKERRRCKWAETNELFFDYHDAEWGVPEHGDRRLFEIPGGSATISWIAHSGTAKVGVERWDA